MVFEARIKLTWPRAVVWCAVLGLGLVGWVLETETTLCEAATSKTRSDQSRSAYLA